MSDRNWIAELGLETHPEGGYFKRIYTSPHSFSAAQGERALATSIYYLLDRRQPLGRLHRNRSDILHYLLDGGPVEYVLLGGDGALRRERLGCGPGEGRFLAVPGGCWKASHLVGEASHALVAEAVTPGFDYADHQFAREEDLRGYPQHLEALRPYLR